MFRVINLVPRYLKVLMTGRRPRAARAAACAARAWADAMTAMQTAGCMPNRLMVVNLNL
eukprot:SAG31_NODE_25487_length_460_cov_0.855956_1_plen_58_part_10